MLFTGTIFGILGVVLAHVLRSYWNYSLILLFPILMAIVLGFGFYIGARIGRCCRLGWGSALIVLMFSLVGYGVFLFLNDYYERLDPKPTKVQEEYFLLAEEVQNFLGKLPYILDYIQPVENSELGDIGTEVVTFLNKFPDMARYTPVVIGSVFNSPRLEFMREYLIHPGITSWQEENGQLVFDNNIAQTWMIWIGEFLVAFVVALLITRSATKAAYQKRLGRFKKAGYSIPKGKAKAPKEKRRKKKRKEEPDSGLDLTPAPTEDESVQEEQKAEKKGFSFFGRKKKAKAAAEEEPAPEIAEKGKKKKRKWFGRKSEEPEAQAGSEQVPETAGTADTGLKMELPEEQQAARYALILHQYDSSRHDDLIRLIQQVGQVSEDRARRLLKVPSLIKQDVPAQEAGIAIEKFKQVDAQVKLITMEQLLELQKKQQQPAQPAASKSQPSSPETAEERYALILRSFGSAQQKPVLELLSSLSGTPVAQLQQSLNPPVSILRDATKDEVTMIAQQFQNLQADVIILTMAKLQKLMAKK